MDAQQIIDAVTKVTEPWARQVKREERDRSARLRRVEALTRRRERSRRVTLREAVFAVMPEGIAKASGGGRAVYPKRNLYYSVRKLIQDHTAEALSYGYFEQVLQKWEDEHGPASGKYCDPRGYFVEPHTGLLVPLGTREVDGYSIPAWRYDKILFVEKKGFHELFKIGRVAERFDIGIICAEGYAADAAKLLLNRAEKSGRMTILALHDADPFGYNIARRLRDATRIEAGGTINVIDMGLSLQDALDLGLDTEDFVRDKALPQGLVLNDIEREYFEGKPDGVREGREGGKHKQLYRCRRVELNALAADPDRFIRYVEEKLRKHGCAEKLVPPASVVLERAAALRAKLLEEIVRAKLAELLNTDSLAADLARNYAGRVSVKDTPKVLTEWAGRLEPVSWDDCLHGEIDGQVRAVADALGGEVHVRLRDLATRL